MDHQQDPLAEKKSRDLLKIAYIRGPLRSRDPVVAPVVQIEQHLHQSVRQIVEASGICDGDLIFG